MLAFVVSGVAVMLGLLFLETLPLRTTGLAAATNDGLLAGLLVLGVISGFIAVSRLKESR